MSTDSTKYAEAVRLFQTTDLSRKEICARCHLTVGEFSAYLQRHQRNLIVERQCGSAHLKISTQTKLRGKSGQGLVTRAKYKEAILACRDSGFIHLNISEIARLFQLNPTGLGNQLRAHYPDVLEWRYNEQTKLGIHTFQQKAAAKMGMELYGEAIELLRSSDLTIKEVAEKCQVSFSGLKQHLGFYHKDLVRQRERTRERNKGQRYAGKKTGSNALHVPKTETVAKYAEALELMRTSSLLMKEVAARCGVSLSGLYGYLRTWHRDLLVARRGITCQEEVEVADLHGYKHYLAASREKYAAAIDDLKAQNESTAAVAKRFGLHPETFRCYLREHEPDLGHERGMIATADGKRVLKRCVAKYEAAVEAWKHTEEPLSAIARRLNLNLSSLGGFLRRHYPMGRRGSLQTPHELQTENEI